MTQTPQERSDSKTKAVNAMKMATRYGNDKDALEEQASIVHVLWSLWMTHVFDQCTSGEDPEDRLILKEEVECWTRQMNTPYQHLSEEEKENTRGVALRFMSKCTECTKKEQSILEYKDLEEKYIEQQDSIHHMQQYIQRLHRMIGVPIVAGEGDVQARMRVLNTAYNVLQDVLAPRDVKEA